MPDAEFKVKNPMIISAVVSLATFMEVLDTTVANVALVHIAGSLGAGTEESSWVLTSYLVSNAIVLPLSGWLSGVFGRKNFFLFCIASFTLTSLLCGISTTLPMLIFFRLLQGLAGGGLQPTQQAIINDSFPPERLPTAFAITGITIVVAPIFGPILGGYITDHSSWHWIFFMNIPIGILSFILTAAMVEDPPTAQKKNNVNIDGIGLGAIAVGLGALQYVLDKGQQEDWFGSSLIICGSAVAALTLLFAVFWLWRQKNPIVDLKLLKEPAFGSSCLMMFFMGFTLYGGTTMLSMLAQRSFGYDAMTSGLVISPGGIAVILMMPIASRLAGALQARHMIAIGMALMAGGMWLTTLITPQTDFHTLVWIRACQMAGLPFLFVSVNTLAFSRIGRKNSSNATAVIALARNIGGGVGIALTTTIVARGMQTFQTQLAQRLTPADIGYNNAISHAANAMTSLGIPKGEATSAILMHVYQGLIQQSAFLSYMNAYQVLSVLMALLAIAALFMPSNTPLKKMPRSASPSTAAMEQA